MDLEKYEIIGSKDFLEYTFYSEGPRGKIRKMVKFTEHQSYLGKYYNLAFGDWNDKWLRIDDLAISNNGDTSKILATISSSIMEFNKKYPEAIIFAKGSTSSRTRRYQIEINKYLRVIKPVFEVFGLTEGQELIPFQPRINYLFFIAIPKKI